MRCLIFLFLLASCHQGVPPVATKTDTVVHDTVYQVRVDTVPKPELVYLHSTDTLYRPCTHQKQIDSLKTALFVAGYRLERVRYYLKIAIRNPSQDKFLKGWIKRALD